MRRFQRTCRRQLAVLSATIACAFIWPGLTLAEDEQEDEQLVAGNLVVQNQFVLTPETFDSWVFNAGGNGAAPQAFQQLDSQFRVRMDAVDRACKLTDAQKKKLQAAGAMDIKRFRDHYEQLKDKYQNTKRDQNKINEVFNEIQPLQREYRDVFGPSCLLTKVIKYTLDPEQSASTSEEDDERVKFHYRAKVEMALSILENAMPITDEQRQSFETLLLEETQPPRMLVGQADFYFVMVQAAKLSKDKLGKIFDKAQMAALQKIFDQSRGYEPMFQEGGQFYEPH